jgi:hypothetical protein
VLAVSGSSWIRPVVLAVSCLILGFVGGWSLATLGGDNVSLPDASVDLTVQEPAPRTTTVETQAEQPPARNTVVVAVLNGTTRSGFAATTAAQLKTLGYTSVSTGNTPGQTGPTVIYYRDAAKLAADQLAKDMRVDTVTPIAGTPLALSAPASAQLIVVLGT